MKIGISSWTFRKSLEQNTLAQVLSYTSKKFGIVYWEGAISHFNINDNPTLWSKSNLINIVGLPKLNENTYVNFADDDINIVNKSITVAKNWITWASKIDGIKGIKFNPGSGCNFRNALVSYSSLNEYAKTMNLQLLIENSLNKGPIANPNIIIKLLKEVNDNNFGLVLDLGNFEEDQKARYRQIESLFQYTKYVEMKTRQFKNQMNTTIKELRFVKDLGYDSYVFIDYSSGIDWELALDFTMENILVHDKKT